VRAHHFNLISERQLESPLPGCQPLLPKLSHADWMAAYRNRGSIRFTPRRLTTQTPLSESVSFTNNHLRELGYREVAGVSCLRNDANAEGKNSADVSPRKQ
jgi:hypothetical protein